MNSELYLGYCSRSEAAAGQRLPFWTKQKKKIKNAQSNVYKNNREPVILIADFLLLKITLYPTANLLIGSTPQ